MVKLKSCLIPLFLLSLAACSTTPGPERLVTLNIPDSLLITYPDLEEEKFDLGLDLINSYLKTVSGYYDIQANHNELVDYIKRMQAGSKSAIKEK